MSQAEAQVHQRAPVITMTANQKAGFMVWAAWLYLKLPNSCQKLSLPK